MKDPQHLNDVVNVSLTYGNGSIGTIAYLANGDKSLPKERVEIFGNGYSAVLEDFKSLAIYARGRKKETKLINQDKGQKHQVRSFVDAIINGSGSPITPPEIYSATIATFKVLESIRTGVVLNLG